jgi:DNA-binding IclR family transcriptional regulator
MNQTKTIFEKLKEKPHSIEELMQDTGMPRPSIRRCLHNLKTKGLLKKRDNKWIMVETVGKKLEMKH